MDEKKAVVEAALFLSEEPLDTDELADVMNVGSKGYVATIIDQLKEDLEADDRGLKIVEENGRYEMVVKSRHVEQVEHLAPHRDLDEAALRTLALIAYNAPVKQSEIVDVRGNRAYTQIKELVERGFVSAEKDGRTKVLDVTDHFLDYFDLDTARDFVMQAEHEAVQDDEEDVEESLAAPGEADETGDADPEDDVEDASM